MAERRAAAVNLHVRTRLARQCSAEAASIIRGSSNATSPGAGDAPLGDLLEERHQLFCGDQLERGVFNSARARDTVRPPNCSIHPRPSEDNHRVPGESRVKLHYLTISRFRGIKEFEWKIAEKTACLVGPGDSSKSTILTAIEYVLLPHSNLRLTDADFYGCDATPGFTINATVGDLPSELLTEEKFGHHIRGLSSDGELHDEPENDDTEVLTVRLSADASLEPRWQVVNDRNPDGPPLSHWDRAKLGMVRLGQEIDRDLSWTRFSALTKFTEEGMSGVSQHLSEAHRRAREAVRVADLGGLNETAQKLQRAAEAIGVSPRSEFRALLEPSVVQLGVGPLSLHDGDVPLRSAGLGTRRLVALALQAESVRNGAIVIVDEIETGLDPHRLRHLIRVLLGTAPPPDDRPALGAMLGNCFFTTHSATTLRELGTQGLSIVRADEGQVNAQPVPDDLDRMMRTQPEAVLARRVLVCEGATEVGFCRALDDRRVAQKGSTPLTVAGTFILNGRGGSFAETFACQFASLGFETGLLADSDVEGKPDETSLQGQGIQTFIWDGAAALEERVALDLPRDGLRKFVKLAVKEHGAAPIATQIKQGLSSPVSAADVEGWAASGLPDDSQSVRRAIGKAAKGKAKENTDRGWFKQGDAAYALGLIVAEHLSEIPETPLATLIARLMPWLARE